MFGIRTDFPLAEQTVVAAEEIAEEKIGVVAAAKNFQIAAVTNFGIVVARKAEIVVA